MPADALKKTLVALETKLLEPEFRRSRVFLENTLHEGFIEIGASGRRYDKQAAINQVQQQSHTDFSLSDFQATPLSENIVLLTYCLTISNGSTESRDSARSSVWKKENDNWQIIFHQGTNI